MHRINLKGQEMENKNASIIAPFGVEALPPPVAPKGPFADYSAEEVEAYAREYVAPYVERIRHLERELAELSKTPEPRRCKACHSPRKGETCHKCGDPTFVPHASWEEPALPPVDRVRELAREVGYAIGEHGTKERDLDLIAAPWTEDAIGNHALFEHIAKGLGARIVEVERKPLGRYAATLQMDGWYKNIDLSVCPFDGRTAGTAPADAALEAAAKLAIKFSAVPRDVLGPATVQMKSIAAVGEKIAAAILALKGAGTASEAAPEAETVPTCWCRACNMGRMVDGIPYGLTTMILCPTCSNKRCPKASGHTLACTGSNEPGQVGSVYAAAPSTQEGAND